jgi:hypothetical protein
MRDNVLYHKWESSAGKQTWNKFTTSYPSATEFKNSIGSSRPKNALILDSNGRKLPTPYSLIVCTLAGRVDKRLQP